MKKKYVFDAGPVYLYFGGSKEVKTYFDEIFRGRAIGYMCEINLAEYYYKSIKVIGVDATEIRYISLRKQLIIVPPDETLTRKAARIKLKFERTLSLADAYAIALNSVVKGLLLTTDKKLYELNITKARLIKI